MVIQQEILSLPQANTSKSFWKDAWKEAVWIFLISRLILLLVTFVGPSVFPHYEVEYHTVNHQERPVRVIRPPVQCAVEVTHCLLAWDTWDVGVFVGVAHHGYPNIQNKQNLVAFFPAWPLLLHIIGVHFGNTYTTLFYIGLVLANMCFFIALILLYILVATDFGPKIAKDALFFLALGPYALFFFIGYSEAFFLLLCLGMFFFLARGRALDWWLAGLCGFLAALTRSLGIVLALPFLIILIQRFWPERFVLRAQWRSVLNAALPLLLIPLGLLLYMLYLGITKGNMLAFTNAEADWGRSLDFPWTGIVNAFISFINYKKNFEENVMDLIFTLIPLIGLLLCWKHLPLHYNLFALAMMLFALTHPINGILYPLSSSPRFMMVIFPLYILFALWCKKPRMRSMLMTLSVALFTINALLFICHGWVA